MRKAFVAVAVLVVLFSSADGVFAAQSNESRGPDGYGWQQVYAGTGPDFQRLTGSADRQYYDYGFKGISIFMRIEDYWSQDCGWWYVSNPSVASANITIYDNNSAHVTSNGSLGPLFKGTTYVEYNWGASVPEKPGDWTVVVTDGTANAIFKIFVRGQLNVSLINVDTTSPTVGSPVYINATIQDHDGTTLDDGTSTSISPVMFVTGPGFYAELNMAGGTNKWNSNFTPTSTGEYFIAVKASDGHLYWVDGRGSNSTTVTGPFAASFAVSSLLQIALLLLLSLLITLQLNSKIKGKKI